MGLCSLSNVINIIHFQGMMSVLFPISFFYSPGSIFPHAGHRLPLSPHSRLPWCCHCDRCQTWGPPPPGSCGGAWWWRTVPLCSSPHSQPLYCQPNLRLSRFPAPGWVCQTQTGSARSFPFFLPSFLSFPLAGLRQRFSSYRISLLLRAVLHLSSGSANLLSQSRATEHSEKKKPFQ